MEQLAPTGLLEHLLIPKKIWEDIAMDFIERLPLSNGKSAIFIVVDWLSKYVHFAAISHPYTAPQISKVFFDYVMPRTTICDRDLIFISLFWQEFF